MDVTPRIEALVGRWLGLMDRELPDVVAGCYGVGSLALGDFSEHVSGIDLVLCSEEPWSDEQLRTAEDLELDLRIHGHRPHVTHVSFAELAEHGPLPDPYTRDVLFDALVWRGPSRPRTAISDGDVEAWATGLLAQRWRPWARSARLRPAKGWMKRTITPPVLEVCRLHAASLGHVLSKSEAARLVLAEAPNAYGRRRILDEALSFRYGASTSNYWGPVERKGDALRLVNELAERASASTVALRGT